MQGPTCFKAKSSLPSKKLGNVPAVTLHDLSQAKAEQQKQQSARCVGTTVTVSPPTQQPLLPGAALHGAKSNPLRQDIRHKLYDLEPMRTGILHLFFLSWQWKFGILLDQCRLAARSLSLDSGCLKGQLGWKHNSCFCLSPWQVDNPSLLESTSIDVDLLW